MSAPTTSDSTKDANALMAVRSSAWLGDVEAFLAELAAPIEPGSDGYHERDLGKCNHWCIACRAQKLMDAKSPNAPGELPGATNKK